MKERDSKEERPELSLKRRGSRSEGYRKIIYSQGSGRQIEVIKLIGIMGSQSRGVRK